MKRNIQRLAASILSVALVCGLVGCAGSQNGKSAYELAVKNGYDGTELEWLASLAGEVGADGESAYELAVKNGYKGSEAQWLNSLIGASGKRHAHSHGKQCRNQFLFHIALSSQFKMPVSTAQQYVL
jgi:hypothetical protein